MITNIQSTVKTLKSIYKKAEKKNFKKKLFDQSIKKEINFFNENDWLIQRNLIDKKILKKIKSKIKKKIKSQKYLFTKRLFIY